MCIIFLFDCDKEVPGEAAAIEGVVGGASGRPSSATSRDKVEVRGRYVLFTWRDYSKELSGLFGEDGGFDCCAGSKWEAV